MLAGLFSLTAVLLATANGMPRRRRRRKGAIGGPAWGPPPQVPRTAGQPLGARHAKLDGGRRVPGGSPCRTRADLTKRAGEVGHQCKSYSVSAVTSACASSVTGAVVTSAGIVLAATFSVLGVLPLVTLTEIGCVVAFGVLLNNLVVHSVPVPALIPDPRPSHMEAVAPSLERCTVPSSARLSRGPWDLRWGPPRSG